MGVKGLKWFLTQNYEKAWVKKELKNSGPLVVDGSQLCHQLYNPDRYCQLFRPFDMVNGGQYPEFYHQAKTFFIDMKECGIEPHVVFEGVEKMNKLSAEKILETMKRKQGKAKKLLKTKLEEGILLELPKLVYTVFHQLLQELGVSVYVGDGEGDETCAKIANFFKCPILSLDSDFFLFDLPGGYIEIPDLKWQKSLFTANIFYRSRLLSHYSITSESLLQIPAIIGNGIILPCLPDSVTRECFYKKILYEKWSPRSWTSIIQDRCIQAKVQCNIGEACTYYNIAGITIDPSYLPKLLLPSCPCLPAWIVEKYRNLKLSHLHVDAKVNGRQHHCHSSVSKYIRQCSYNILGVDEVEEYHVIRGDPTKIVVPSCEVLRCRPLQQIPEMSLSDRQSVFSSILGCTSANLERIGEFERLFLSSVAFWKNNMHVPLEKVKALLVCYLLCSMHERLDSVRRKHIPETYRISTEWVNDRKYFWEWQCTYDDAMDLNLLLQSPFAVICPSKIFDGKILMLLASNMDMNEAIRPCSISQERLDQLLEFVISTGCK